jgi:ABC-2 type transport system ATP-binding protein
MSIEVRHLSKTYGEQKALDDISFSVGKGEIVGFLGPNGAGKSTTMKILTAYLPATSGEAFVCGKEVARHSLEIQRMIGYLPESNPLYPDMYVREYLWFVAGMYRMPDRQRKRRIDEMIAQTGLQPECHKKIGALSKGYRQRVGLAQALIHDPEVLIMDEPTSGLDPNQLAEIRQLIRSLGENKTVLLSTHIMQEVQAVCDRAIVISRGRIVADASLEALRSRGAAGRISVVFDGRVEQQAMEAVEGVETATLQGERGWLLLGAQPELIRKNLLRFALQNNLNIVSLQSDSSSLEEVFRALTQPSASRVE